jgi:hypothetical protein
MDIDRNISVEDRRIEAICRKGFSYATNGQVLRFKDTWFDEDSHHGFFRNFTDPNVRYNKDGNSDLVLVSSDQETFQVHTMILSNAS